MMEMYKFVTWSQKRTYFVEKNHLPFIPKENIIKIIIDMQKFLCDFFIGYVGKKFNNSLLHCSAGTI